MTKTLRIDKIHPLPLGIDKAELAEVVTLTLPYEVRSRSRFSALLSDGSCAVLFLPRGNILADGDVLIGEDGSLVRVIAAEQPLIMITSPDRRLLMRAAYHLGNRHIPVQVGQGFLCIEPDSVLEDMLVQLGVELTRRNGSFEPESGAYGGGHRHGHAETFDTDYELAQKVFADHA